MKIGMINQIRVEINENISNSIPDDILDNIKNCPYSNALYLCTQYILLKYIEMFVSTNTQDQKIITDFENNVLLNDFKKQLRSDVNFALLQNISKHQLDEKFSYENYQLLMITLNNLYNGLEVDPIIIVGLLEQYLYVKAPYHYYFNHFYNKNAFVPILHGLYNRYDEKEYPDNVLADAVLFIPKLTIYENDHEKTMIDIVMIKAEDPNTYYTFETYEYDTDSTKYMVADYLSNFKMDKINFTNIVGILSTFNLNVPHGMFLNRKGLSLPHICERAMINKHPVSTLRPNQAILDFWKSILCTIIERFRFKLNTEDNNILLGKILQQMGESEQLINYFMNDPISINISELEAYEQSVFNSLKYNPIKSSNEDITEDSETDDLSEDDSELDENTTDTGVIENTIVQDNELEIIIEESSSSDTLQNMLFIRKTIITIDDILLNPQSKYKFNQTQLQWLKKWVSHWINLVSVEVTKNFLKKLNITIN